MKYAILIESPAEGPTLLGPYDTQAEAESILSRLEIAGLSCNEVRSVRIIEQYDPYWLAAGQPYARSTPPHVVLP